MAHMLATANPRAAAEIDTPPELPDVGTIVVFKARAGFQRMHRTEFPAMVLGETASKPGTLDLLVQMEPDDETLETGVPFQSHDQSHFCWRWRRRVQGEIDADPLHARIAATEEQLAGDDVLMEQVEALGARVKDVESVLASDEIEVLEKRIVALEKAAKKG